MIEAGATAARLSTIAAHFGRAGLHKWRGHRRAAGDNGRHADRQVEGGGRGARRGRGRAVAGGGGGRRQGYVAWGVLGGRGPGREIALTGWVEASTRVHRRIARQLSQACFRSLLYCAWPPVAHAVFVGLLLVLMAPPS